MTSPSMSLLCKFSCRGHHNPGSELTAQEVHYYLFYAGKVVFAVWEGDPAGKHYFILSVLSHEAFLGNHINLWPGEPRTLSSTYFFMQCNCAIS